MSDLARKAAQLIGRIEGWHEDSPLEHVISAIEEVGTLVSHEDAALLREVKRMVKSLESTEEVNGEAVFCSCEIRGLGNPAHPLLVTVEVVDGNMEATHHKKITHGNGELTAALKTALDAAGVPDAKGT